MTSTGLYRAQCSKIPNSFPKIKKMTCSVLLFLCSCSNPNILGMTKMKKEPIFDLFLGLKIYIEVALCNFFLINLIFGLIILKFQNCEKQSYYIAIITTIFFHDQWQVNCRQIEFHWWHRFFSHRIFFFLKIVKIIFLRMTSQQTLIKNYYWHLLAPVSMVKNYRKIKCDIILKEKFAHFLALWEIFAIASFRCHGNQ